MKKNKLIVVGALIEFNGNRIHKSNPVKGKVMQVHDDPLEPSFSIKLYHDIEGINTVWYEGTEKTFYLSTISIKSLKRL